MINIAEPFFAVKPPRKLPRGLIYHVPNSDLYNLIDTKNGNYVGKMIALTKDCTNSSLYYNVEPDARLLRVYKLKIFEKRKGWGTYLMHYAMNESYNLGCKGRLALVAHNPEKPPHVFYKKIGLVTKSESQNKMLDEYIARGIEPNRLNAMDMFVPIKAYEKKELPNSQKKLTFWEKTSQFIKNFFENI